MFTLSDTDFSVELSKAVCSSSDDVISYENNQTCYPVLFENVGQEFVIGFDSYGIWKVLSYILKTLYRIKNSHSAVKTN